MTGTKLLVPQLSKARIPLTMNTDTRRVQLRVIELTPNIVIHV